MMMMASPLLLVLLVQGGQSWRSPFPRPPPPPLEQGAGPPPEPLWFEQLLDHFNVRDDRWAASSTHSSTTVSTSLYLPPPRVWQQRYWAGWEHYRPGGPVFLLIGGEGEETPGWLRAGALSDYAQQFNGRQSSDGVLVQ